MKIWAAFVKFERHSRYCKAVKDGRHVHDNNLHLFA